MACMPYSYKANRSASHKTAATRWLTSQRRVVFSDPRFDRLPVSAFLFGLALYTSPIQHRRIPLSGCFYGQRTREEGGREMTMMTPQRIAVRVLLVAAVGLMALCVRPANALVQGENEFPYIPLPNGLVLRLHAAPTEDGWLATADPSATEGEPMPNSISLDDPSVLGNIPSGTDPLHIVPVVNYATPGDAQTWQQELAPLSIYLITKLQAGTEPQIQFGTECPGLFSLGADEQGLLYADTCPPPGQDGGETHGVQRHSTNVRVAADLTFIAVAFNSPSKEVAVYVNSTFAIHTFPHDGADSFPQLRLSGPQQVSDMIAHEFAYHDAYVNTMNTHFWSLINNGRPAEYPESVSTSTTASSDDTGSDDDTGSNAGDGDDDETLFGDDDEVLSEADNGDEWYTCLNGVSSHAGEYCQCTYGCAKCLLPPHGVDEQPLCTLCTSNEFVLHQGQCLLECPTGFQLVQSGDDGKKTCQKVHLDLQSTQSPDTGSTDGNVGDSPTNTGGSSSGGDGVLVDDTTLIGIAVGLVLLALVIAAVEYAVQQSSKRKHMVRRLENGLLDN